MATDLTIMIHDRPGAAADVADALGRSDVNIEGVCCTPSDGYGELHVVVADAARAREALHQAGIKVTDEREVLLLDVEDRPGVLADIARRVADAGVNLATLYLATNTRLVLGAEDLDGLRRAVS
jgi:hypothetical protein